MDQVWRGLERLGRFTGQGHWRRDHRLRASTEVSDLREPHRGPRRLRQRHRPRPRLLRSRHAHRGHHCGLVADERAQSASSNDDDFRGMAPGAHLINLRVLGADGSGKTSDALEAIDWAIDNKARYNIRVMNISLGHPVIEAGGDDPLVQAVEACGVRGHRGHLLGGQHGQARPTAQPLIGAINVAGQLAGRDHGGCAEHVQHAAAFRRSGDDLQLAWSDVSRRSDQAGPGRAGQQDRLAGSAARVAGEGSS